jgi:hypothetical protein
MREPPAVEPVTRQATSRAALALVTVLLGVAPAAKAADANLFPNGDFSQSNQLAGWSCLSGSWSSDDAAAGAGSGSMWLQNFLTTAGHCTSSCIAVRPGSAYSIRGQSRVLFGNPVVSFTCTESFNTQCTSVAHTLPGPAMSSAYAWNDTPAAASGILTSGTLSLQCTATLGSQDAGGISGHFDNLFFATDDIFFQGFEPQ